MIKRVRKAMFVLLCLLVLAPGLAFARLEKLSDEALAAITGMGAVDFSILGGDTARFFFDVHAEIYAEIDSVKLGYYQKTDLTTRKFLSADDPHVVDNGNGTFDIVENGSVVQDNLPFHVYVDDDNLTHTLAYCDNDFYQYQYQNTAASGAYYVDGRQGENNVNVSGELFSSNRTVNQNNMDWDINIENLRIGTSPDEPMVIDGLVVHLKYDDINSPVKRLTDIIIGTNSMEGDFYGDLKRITGYVNTKLPQTARNTDPALTELVQALNQQSTPMGLNRDSFLMLADHYRAAYDTPDDGNLPHPEDPTNNNIDTGMFLRIGLDPSSAHFGYSIIAGYNEIVANAYEPSSKMLKAAITDWWDN